MTKITHAALLLVATRTHAPAGQLHLVQQETSRSMCGLATFLLTPGAILQVGSDAEVFCWECLTAAMRAELVRVEVPRAVVAEGDLPPRKSGRRRSPPAWSINPFRKEPLENT